MRKFCLPKSTSTPAAGAASAPTTTFCKIDAPRSMRELPIFARDSLSSLHHERIAHAHLSLFSWNKPCDHAGLWRRCVRPEHYHRCCGGAEGGEERRSARGRASRRRGGG